LGGGIEDGLSGDEESEEGAVEPEAFDDVEENEFVELPELDRGDTDGVEEDGADEGKVNSDDPSRDADSRRGLLERKGFEGRTGVAGAVGGGVGTACDNLTPSDDVGASSRR